MATASIYADPQRVPFVDIKTGKLTREGFLFLLGVKSSVPSDPGTSLDALEVMPLAGTAELVAQLQAIEQAAAVVPPNYPQAQADQDEPAGLAELRERVAALEQLVQSLTVGPIL